MYANFLLVQLIHLENFSTNERQTLTRRVHVLAMERSTCNEYSGYTVAAAASSA